MDSAQLHRAFPQPPSALVAIIIDDFGDHRSTARRFFVIDQPLTYAILPGRPLSRWTAQVATALDREIMLHLPMEPHGYPEQDPGPMAILAQMETKTIRSTIKEALASVPGVVGVDNHMGSRITEDSEIMRIILSELMQRNLFYIDSLTTPHSVAYDMGLEMGMRVARNRVFLDNHYDVDYIKQQLHHLGDVALRHGRAVGIGHVSKSTAEALRDGIPELEARGIRIVPASRLVSRGTSP